MAYSSVCCDTIAAPKDSIAALKTSARQLLEDNILHFWLTEMQDHEQGGFYGRMDGCGTLHTQADKGCVLNARILWTFAAAYRVLGKQAYLDAAVRAKDYILNHFIDKERGGVYWSVDYTGLPVDMKKQSYAIGFTIYGMSELYRALKTSMPLKGLEEALRTLIGIFTQKLLNPKTRHLDLFFDDEWHGQRNIESYGHDIEAAWLLTEALEVLGDDALTKQTMPIVGQIAHASEEGLLPDGSMIHERRIGVGEGLPASVDADLHWWVQCENVIGQLNQYQHFHDEAALQKALRCYHYIERNLVDREDGEWYWSRRPDGTVNRDEDKAGPWKCPCHNSRMCLEIIERPF